MLFKTNAKKTLKSINYPLVAQLMSQVPGEERKKTANVSIFCNTYTTLYVIQYITQYKYKKQQYELPTCCPAHVSSPGRGVEEAANICCTKNKYKTMMRPVTITLGHPIPELEH